MGKINNSSLVKKKNTMSTPVLSIYVALSALYLIFFLDLLAASLLSDSHILKMEKVYIHTIIFPASYQFYEHYISWIRHFFPYTEYTSKRTRKVLHFTDDPLGESFLASATLCTSQKLTFFIHSTAIYKNKHI